MAKFCWEGHATLKEWRPFLKKKKEDRGAATQSTLYQTLSQMKWFFSVKMAKTNPAVFSNRSVQPQTNCSLHRRCQAKNHWAVGVHNLCIIQAVKCPSKHAKGDLSNPSLERPSQTLLIRSPFTRASGLAGDNKAKWIPAHRPWEWLRRTYSIHQS